MATGDTEPVEVQVFGRSGLPLTGKTDIKIRVRRHNDDLYFDWTDNTFKSGGSVAQMLQALSEVSASLSPGIYRLNVGAHVRGFNTGAVTNPGIEDIYDVTIVQDSGLDAVGLPVGFEIKVGRYVDKIAGLPGNVADAVWDEMQADHVVANSFGDLMRRVVALQKENYFIDNMTYNTKGLLLAGRIRLFATKAAAAAATDGGTGEGEFAIYSFDTTEKPGPHEERAATARSVRDS